MGDEGDAEEHGRADLSRHLGLADHRLDRVTDHEADPERTKRLDESRLA